MNIFEALINTNTASGAECSAADIIAEKFKAVATEIKKDALGNLIVKIGNNTENDNKTAVFASIDAPGLVVTYIEDNGTVKVSPLGGCDYRSSCCSDVTNGKITGILIPDNGDSDSVDKSHVNFGFKDRTEAESFVSEGDVLFFAKAPVLLKNGYFAGVGLGSKAVTAAVCMAAEKIASGKCVYLVFCTQSALYQRGAYPAAFGVKPDKALCLAPYTGKNFAVKVLDKSLVCDKELTDAAFNAASKYAESTERVVLPGEMSDAGKIQSAYAGVRVASIMLPTKNLGSTVETVNSDDIATLADITAEFLNNI